MRRNHAGDLGTGATGSHHSKGLPDSSSFRGQGKITSRAAESATVAESSANPLPNALVERRQRKLPARARILATGGRSARARCQAWTRGNLLTRKLHAARLAANRSDTVRFHLEVRVSNETQRPRARRLPRAVRERQILDAAVAVFSQHGYHAASMDEVAEVAGVSKPMVYAYLGSKEDLFAACIRREANRLIEAVTNGVATDAELAPDMQLWHGLRSFFHFVGQNRQSWTVLHRQALSVGGSFAAEISTMRDRSIELVARVVVSAGTKQGIGDQAEKSADGLAAALVGAAESLADWWLDHPDVTDGTLASWLMNLVWLGFGDLVQGEVWKPS